VTFLSKSLTNHFGVRCF